MSYFNPQWVRLLLSNFIENYPDSAREAKTADIDFWERKNAPGVKLMKMKGIKD